jgi:quercetin dioxygenase-like cupin family protein
MKTYETATIAGLARPNGWSPIRRELDVQAFGINAWTADAGERLIPGHDEKPSGHEELYVVTAGRATFTVGGDEIDAPAGTVVFVRDPAAQREARAAEDGTTVLAVGGRPGGAYRPRSWETNVDATPLWEAGDFEGIKRLMLDALERYEDRGTILYNLACAEAQLGEVDAAREHLAQAVAERPEFADAAREDSDLAPLYD